jgi:hypothetical protein
MTSATEVFTITIRRRPWWFWALAGIWLVAEVVIFQTAFASVRESEYRAATVCWIAAAVLAGGGVFGWLSQGQHGRPGKSSSQVQGAASKVTINITSNKP